MKKLLRKWLGVDQELREQNKTAQNILKLYSELSIIVDEHAIAIKNIAIDLDTFESGIDEDMRNYQRNNPR